MPDTERSQIREKDARAAHTVRTTSQPLQRVSAETKERDSSFVMASYHIHPYYELYYVEHGACRFFIDNELYDLHAGDFLLIPPRTPHYTRYLFGDCRRSCLFFRDRDLEESVRQHFPPLSKQSPAMDIFTAPASYRPQFEQFFRRLSAEDQIQDACSEDMTHHILQEFLLTCGRCCEFPEKTPASIHTGDRQILTAARYMSAHFREPVSAEMIADAAGFSANYFSRKFREATGMRVHEYLVLLRLKSAALELLSTQDSITEIALRNGFSDSNYFKDAFKKMYGVSPRAYRS